MKEKRSFIGFAGLTAFAGLVYTLIINPYIGGSA
jgi:hypothetical protein